MSSKHRTPKPPGVTEEGATPWRRYGDIEARVVWWRWPEYGTLVSRTELREVAT